MWLILKRGNLFLYCSVFFGLCFADNVVKQTILWERELPFLELNYSIKPSDTIIYVTTNSNLVQAIHLKTGKTIWTVTYTDTVSLEFSKPLVDGNTIFFGNRYGCYYSLDSKTLKKNFSLLWDRKEPPPYCACPSGGVAFDSTIAILGLFKRGGRIQCLKKKTGKVLWEKMYDSVATITPLFSDGKSIFAEIGNLLVCLDCSGKVKWEYPGGENNFNNFELEFIQGQIIYCSKNAIQSVSMNNGKPIWIKEGIPFGHITPSIMGNSIIADTGYNGIASFDLKTGDQKWTYHIPEEAGSVFKPIEMGQYACCGSEKNDSSMLNWLNIKNGNLQYRTVLERKGHICQVNKIRENDLLVWSVHSKNPDSLAYSVLRRIRFSFQ